VSYGFCLAASYLPIHAFLAPLEEVGPIITKYFKQGMGDKEMHPFVLKEIDTTVYGLR
jgi:hypothetical protein